MQDLPSIREISLLDVLSEGNGSVAIDRNIYSHVSTDFAYETQD